MGEFPLPLNRALSRTVAFSIIALVRGLSVLWRAFTTKKEETAMLCTQRIPFLCLADIKMAPFTWRFTTTDTTTTTAAAAARSNALVAPYFSTVRRAPPLTDKHLDFTR